MQNYSIIPLLDICHADEICHDIKNQYENGIADCALFSLTLVPEGNPVIDKAKIMCEKYDVFRDKLKEFGLECGILVQASIGHGYRLNERFPFQPVISLTDGAEREICCPYDENFREHFKGVMKTLALHKPKIIMLDDDFRLMNRPSKGCACPLHLKRLAEIIGEPITRDELLEHTKSHDEKSLRITKAFIKTQGESLIGAAKAMREGIDEVDPNLPGVFCCCGNAAEFAGEIAEILAGRGNPVTVRINNGNYTPSGARGQSVVAFRAAIQKIHMGDKVQTILAETDTCPQNRYSTSALSLHTHFVVSVLEGAAGAKHWITRTIEYEPKSGKAYRDTLAKYSGFYNTLSKIVPKLTWVGANNFLSKEPAYGYENEFQKSCHWAHCVLERMGIPLFYSSKISGVVFLDGDDAKNFTDDECIKILSGTCVLSSSAAKIFNERGYTEYTGVSVKEWNGANTSFERISPKGKKVKTQQQIMELVKLYDDVIEDSTVYNLKDGKDEIPLFPGCTIYKNKLGGRVIVYAGTPEAHFSYRTAFSFLSESRKEQLVRQLKENGSLPIYLIGDDEVYMKAGFDGNDLYCTIVNTGFDPIERINLCVEKKVARVEKLMPDGTFADCDFSLQNETLIIEAQAIVLQPVVLKIS